MYPIRSLDSSDPDDSANPELRHLSLSFKRLDPAATLPTRGSSQAAGLDIFSIEEVVIEPKQRSLVRTGLAVAIPEGYYGRVAPRSVSRCRMASMFLRVLLTRTIAVKCVACSTTLVMKQYTCRRRLRFAS